MDDNTTKTSILFISGSPRRRASVLLVELLEEGARRAGAATTHFCLYEKHIDPCVGCGGCDKTGVCVLANRLRDGKPADDYLELKSLIDSADAVGIVAPLYFSGPTAQFKALMDRFQPYYVQRYLLGQKARPKRPAQLFIVGSGGDPHGYDPLVGITKSAFQIAGFTIEKVHDFVGFLSAHDKALLQAEAEKEEPETIDAVRLRRYIARQEDFEIRATSAGGAFARYVVKQQEANQLAAQLDAIKAEMEELKAVGDKTGSDEAEGGITTEGGVALGSSLPTDRMPQRSGGTGQRSNESRDFLELEYSNLLRRGRLTGAAVDDLPDDSESDTADASTGKIDTTEPDT